MAQHIVLRVCRGLVGAAALLSPLAAAPASAQALSPADWHQGSSLALFGGTAVPHDDARAAYGGSIAWEFTPRLSIDAGGQWLAAAGRDDVVFGSVGIRYAVRGSRPAMAYVSAGVGLYRASFRDASSQADAPAFYARRMAMGIHGPTAGRRTFDDFAARIGGGVEIFAGRHVSIRPTVDLIVVTAAGHRQIVPAAGVHVAYHFESHPITPDRR